MNQWEEQRILIWGKTYPEISSKYYETVCTGGVLQNGQFIRLYPIPFRYLSDNKIFTKYQWIRARIKKAKEDPRPESFKVDPESIVAEDNIPTDKFQWFNRAKVVFQAKNFLYDNVESLLAANRINNVSMGFVRPIRIEKIDIENRPAEDYQTFLRKIEANKEKLKQSEMFPIITIEELKRLEYVSQRFKIHWFCDNPVCKGHKMSILDWEVYELVRNAGMAKATQKLNEILDLSKYNTGFFLGNFRLHPKNFSIGGIWYPKRSNLAPNLKLFD